jgi:uncharacterized repeat protein (TIGR03803 family)
MKVRPMRNCNITASLALLAALAPVAATGTTASFSVVAQIADSPVIGAVRNATLYGTTTAGGASDHGSLFSLTTSGTYTLLHSFTGGADGNYPNGGLVSNSASTVFGTTRGGADGYGTLWSFAARTLTTLHTFASNTDLAIPLQGPELLRAALYGSTATGAPNNNGGIFRLEPNGDYKILYNFLSGTDGHCPYSGIAVDSTGTIYGTTVGMGYGGNPTGSVWKLSQSGKLTTIYVFKDASDGEWPDQAPVLDAAGNLYGTTHMRSGASFAGAVWSISKAGRFSVLHDFNASTDGFAPNSPLVRNTNGKLYGSTSSNGPGGYGTVFQITPSGSFTVIHSFANGTDGATPTGNLAHDAAGSIYGGTQSGQVFRIVP